MEHNLIPPFIMREAGLEVNKCPKIHCDDPTVEDYSIYDPETDLRIPLLLHGVFSVFQTRHLTAGEIEDAESMPSIYLTPDSDSWDPYSDTYRLNEDSYLDFRGDLADGHTSKR